MLSVQLLLLLLQHAQSQSFGGLNYDVLGPFPRGSRESADPLEAFGGITGIARGDASALYPSELVDGGYIGWQSYTSDESGRLALNYTRGCEQRVSPCVRLNFLANAYPGRAATAGQSWAIADFKVPATGTYLIQCTRAGSFWIDNQYFRGNVYAANWWFGNNAWMVWPVSLTEFTIHTLRVQMTGSEFTCSFHDPNAVFPFAAQDPPLYTLYAQSSESLEFNPGLVTHLPDLVGGHLAGEWLMLPLVNAGTSSVGGLLGGAVEVSVVAAVVIERETQAAVEGGDVAAAVSVSEHQVPYIRPGQVMPVNVHLAIDSAALTAEQRTSDGGMRCNNQSQAVVVALRIAAPAEYPGHSILRNVTLQCRNFPFDPYTFTFFDVDGSLQYASALPPLLGCNASSSTGGSAETKQPCPILFSTHGAGVDAGSRTWKNDAYNRQPHAWVLLPTNRGAYGFDWQGAGRLNALATLAAFSTVDTGVAPATGPMPPMAVSLAPPGVPPAEAATGRWGADGNRVLFAGHSMGGHGCMILSTHYSDRAMAAVCAAGWIKIWQYAGPIFANLDTSFADPLLRGLLSASTADYDTDNYLPNLVGVPFLAMSGSDDSVVSPWNLRRFVRVLNQRSSNATAGLIYEVPFEGHEPDLSDSFMQSFYDQHLSSPYAGSAGAAGATSALPPKPALPSTFTVFALSLWSEGRGGLRVLQQDFPRQLSTIDVSVVVSESTWELSTKNVRRFGISAVAGLASVKTVDAASGAVKLHGLEGTRQSVRVDGAAQALPIVLVPDGHYCKAPSPSLDGTWAWRVCDGMGYRAYERSNFTAGPIRQVLQGPVAIIVGTASPSAAANQAYMDAGVKIANDLFAQGHFGVQVFTDTEAEALIASSSSSSSSPSAASSTTTTTTAAAAASPSLQEHHLILLGGTGSNRLARTLLPSEQCTVRKSLTFGALGRDTAAGADVNGQSKRVEATASGGLESPHMSSGELTGDGGFTLGPPGFLAVGAEEAGVGLALLGAYNASALQPPPAGPRGHGADDARMRVSEGSVWGGVDLGPQRLVVVLAGTDIAGFNTASKLLPTGSNRLVPDFVVAGKDTDWEGSGGYLAAGFLSNDWQVLEAQSYPKVAYARSAMPPPLPPGPAPTLAPSVVFGTNSFELQISSAAGAVPPTGKFTPELLLLYTDAVASTFGVTTGQVQVSQRFAASSASSAVGMASRGDERNENSTALEVTVSTVDRSSFVAISDRLTDLPAVITTLVSELDRLGVSIASSDVSVTNVAAEQSRSDLGSEIQLSSVGLAGVVVGSAAAGSAVLGVALLLMARVGSRPFSSAQAAAAARGPSARPDFTGTETDKTGRLFDQMGQASGSLNSGSLHSAVGSGVGGSAAHSTLSSSSSSSSNPLTQSLLRGNEEDGAASSARSTSAALSTESV